MSDIIHLLPDSVANQIAAGEVIQRPASVIKELVENAIDADAQNIHVLVTDAGKTCIQVIDDGKGMSETDARLSFERHATSKIREAADLFALRTMGFRGEALASIAAVAQVELKTRPESEELGTKLVIAGSQVESQEAISCSKGSNFSVKNLFFNVPARRKFLKANSTELSNILAEFERIALVHPEVAFSLYSNDSELFNLPVSQLRQRILAIFGKKLNQQLLNIDVNTTMVKISGYTAGSTSVTLHNFSHDSYFVMGNVGNGTRDNADSSKNYGKVKEDVSESNLLTHSWTAATTETWAYSSAPGAENRKLLCSFYTAERLFKSDYSDRLSISMANVPKGPSDVTGITGKVIESVTKVDGTGSPTAQPFTEIRRNNVYQVTARVGKIGIQILTISVEDWGERQDIDLDMDM